MHLLSKHNNQVKIAYQVIIAVSSSVYPTMISTIIPIDPYYGVSYYTARRD